MSSPGQHLAASSPRRRCGFTLVEMVLSVAVLSVVVGGLAGVVLIASRALDGPESPPARIADAADALGEVLADLRIATGFSERTATAVTFTVPDRNGDGQPETIRYAWSAVPGDPLVRQYNGGAPVEVARAVQHLSFSYLTQVLDPPAQNGQESQELLLIGHTAPGGSARTYTIGSRKWCATYFKPGLPTNTLHWKITRVRFMAMRANPVGQVLDVQIRPADAREKPASQVLGAVAVPESSLPWSLGWVEVPVASVTHVEPGTGLCLVLAQPNGNGEAAIAAYEQAGHSMTANAHWMTTSNAGASWSNPNNSRDMLFEVYGTVTTQGAPQWP